MLLPLHLVWKLNAPQLWEPPDGVINTNAGAVYRWRARDRWKVLGLSLHWSVMWATHRCNDSGIPWPLPSTPPREILAVVVVVVIVCVWIHSRVRKRGHFPRTPAWFDLWSFKRAARDTCLPKGGSHRSGKPAPLLSPPGLAWPFVLINYSRIVITVCLCMYVLSSDILNTYYLTMMDKFPSRAWN